MRNHLMIAALTVMPFAASAQPYSESMADCASQFQNAAQWVSNPDRVEPLMILARKWHAAAVAQSTKEGRVVTDAAMWDRIDAKTAALESKGAINFISQDFRDWTAYCRSFAKHTGVSYDS